MFLVVNPIAFSIGGLEVYWYGIILGLGAAAGLWLAVIEGRRFGIAPDFFMDLLLIGVPSALVGARIYYVIFQWEDYRDRWLDVFKIWEGGIAIYGALIGAVIAAVIYTRRKGYSFFRIADIAAPSLLIGQAIGRWGNFTNQEAYGGPVSELFLRDNLHLPDFIVDQMLIREVYHHPTFLYESIWNLVGIGLLFVLRRQTFVRAGEVFLSYAIWYSVGRFFIEGLRTDSLAFEGPVWLEALLRALWSPMDIVFNEGAMTYLGNIRASQLIGLLTIAVAIALMVYRRKKGYANERYADPIRPLREAATSSGLASDANGGESTVADGEDRS